MDTGSSERNRFAGEPITDDDAAIAAALSEVSVPTLLMSMVHMTGDARYLRWEHVPAGIYLNEVQGFMDPDAQQAVRDEALRVIAAYRDGGCVLPAPPDEALLREMMQVLVASEVPEEYVPLILEELELDGVDARDVAAAVPQSHDDGFSVVVIGAGMSGLLAGIRLADAGIPFTIVEKNPAVGGTWYENRYPGCRVDVGNHFYCYSFEPNTEWTEFFARQPELQAYFERAARDHGLFDHIRFDTEVRAARFDESSGTWAVEVDGPGGVTTLAANAVISAVGQLNRPKLPDIEGIDDFAGRRHALRPMGPVGRSARAAGRSGRHRCERLPDRAIHRRTGGAADRVPAIGSVDVPQPPLPRRGRSGSSLGDASSAVLRPLVPVLAVLAGVRWRPAGDACRPRLAPPGPCGQRAQRRGA